MGFSIRLGEVCPRFSYDRLCMLPLQLTLLLKKLILLRDAHSCISFRSFHRVWIFYRFHYLLFNLLFWDEFYVSCLSVTWLYVYCSSYDLNCLGRNWKRIIAIFQSYQSYQSVFSIFITAAALEFVKGEFCLSRLTPISVSVIELNFLITLLIQEIQSQFNEIRIEPKSLKKYI